MPVRPFYIEAEIEGRKTPLAGGTRLKDGTMTIHITQRDKGEIVEVYKIECFTDTTSGTPRLCTSIYDSNGKLINEHFTDY